MIYALNVRKITEEELAEVTPGTYVFWKDLPGIPVGGFWHNSRQMLIDCRGTGACKSRFVITGKNGVLPDGEWKYLGPSVEPIGYEYNKKFFGMREQRLHIYMEIMCPA